MSLTCQSNPTAITSSYHRILSHTPALIPRSSKPDYPLPLQSPIKLLLHPSRLPERHKPTRFTLKVCTHRRKRSKLLLTSALVGTVIDLRLVHVRFQMLTERIGIAKFPLTQLALGIVLVPALSLLRCLAGFLNLVVYLCFPACDRSVRISAPD